MADDKCGKGRRAESFELGRSVDVDARLGELYEIRDAATGAPGLTLVPKEDVDWKPEGPCRMQLTYEPAKNSVTVTVEQAPAAVRMSELTNLLVLMTAVFRRVEDNARVETHLSSEPARRLDSVRLLPRRLMSSSGWLAATVVVVAMGTWFYSMRPSESPKYINSNAEFEEASREVTVFIGRGASGSVVVAYPMPEKPAPQQAVSPCEAKNGEVEINKGCWVSLEKKPPCAPYHAEYQGKCYLPVRRQDPVPQSSKP